MSDREARARLVIVLGDDGEATREAGRAILETRSHGRPGSTIVDAPPAAGWPFSFPIAPPLPGGPVVIWAPDAHHAVDTRQAQSTRLVTTQAQYLFTEWEAALAAHGEACLVATMSRTVAARMADEVIKRRGVFGRAEIVEAPDAAGAPRPDDTAEVSDPLARAFRLADPAERLAQVVAALGAGRTAPALVAAASVCQEVNDLDGAARDLDEALALASGWAAAWFERGKVCLRRDDMEAAAAAFGAAAERLPGFGGAWGNLGATLGELDRPAEALAAFERLLALDPASPQAANNVGVVTRELGRLAESEAAFRRVIELEPGLAFGYYNLGHTLFLQGRYHAAAAAYGQGQARDPDRNPVQGSRLALCRLAAGDAHGALTELQRASQATARDVRRQLLADTHAILWALVTHKPDLAGWQGIHDWLSGEMARLG